MKLRLYSVLDKAVQAYMPPLSYRSEGEALRSFRDAVASENHQFHKHSADYCFCFIGFYDDNTCAFDTCAPVVVLEGATCLSAEVIDLEQKRSAS